MAENPYQAPKGDRIFEDSSGDNVQLENSSRQSWIASFLMGLFANCLGVVIGPAWLVGLNIGWNSRSFVYFHLTYGLLFLLPSIAVLIFAFAGRARRPDGTKIPSFGNAVGSIGCLFIGTLGVAAYTYFLYLRYS